MEPSKSQDQYKPIIAAMLRDAQTSHSVVFTRRAETLTYRKICRRIDSEGIGFLTKTLPRLGKALDRALSSSDTLTCPYERKLKGTQLPKLFGELFKCVFSSDARVLPTPCVASIRTLRQLCYVFYKVKLPYSSAQEQDVLDLFIETEKQVRMMNLKFSLTKARISVPLDRICAPLGTKRVKLIRRARRLLAKVLCSFDPWNITPRHGPGAVSTKETLYGKYRWSNISDRITRRYPIDQYFYCNLDHVCDRTQEINSLGSAENSARVILVQKDSRGPRLISCEPLENQWIQQGISSALVRHVERHPLTRCRVNFTDQQPNQRAALIGSIDGKYATLDLKEASDRVSLGLVRLLFPEHLCDALETCRSQATRLPNGRILNLEKHAPMGSALCFPIMALSIWAILNAAAGNDTDTRERILVYGDDVIVPRHFASSAIEQLTSFGLQLNQGKCCTEGLFRESCGTDAYSGVVVTPTRLRVPPSSAPRPDHYCAWIAFANSLYTSGWFNTYDYIVQELERIYGPVPDESMDVSSCPRLVGPSAISSLHRSRIDKNLQKRQYRVREVKARVVRKDIDGWMMLLRYFTESKRSPSVSKTDTVIPQMRYAVNDLSSYEVNVNTAVSEYTARHTNKFVWRWR